MADRTIRLVLTMDGETGVVSGFEAITAAAEETAAATDKAAGGIASGMRDIGSRLSSLRSAAFQVKQTGRSMMMLAAPALLVGGYSVKMASDFGHSMMLMRTQVGLTAKQTNWFSKQILNMAGTVGQSPKALADALYPITSVGLRGSAALDALTAAAKGADVSGADLTDTANVLAGALRTNMKDIHSASEAMMVLDKTTTAGKMSLQDLIAAIGTGILPEAKNFGLGMRDIGTALAALSREGMPAEKAATRMRLALTKMGAPTGQTLKAFESIGLAQDTLANDMRQHGLLAALEDLQAHLSSLPANARNVVMAEAFGGSRSSSTVMAMLNAIGSMRQIQPILAHATEKVLNQKFTIWGHTFSGRFAKAIASIQASLIKLGKALAPIVAQWLPKLVGAIKSAASWFSHLSPGVKDVVVGFTAFMAVGGFAVWMLGNLMSAVVALVPVIDGLSAALDFLAANPVMLTVMALVAIGVAIYELIQHVGVFRTAWQDAMQWVQNAATNAVNWVVGAFHTVVNFFSNLPSMIGSAFSAALGFVKGIFGSIVTFMTGGINDIIAALNWLIGKYNSVVGSIPLAGSSLKIGTIAPITLGHHSTAHSQNQGYKLTTVGGQPNNSVSQTGTSHHGGSNAPIILHHTTKIGQRIVAEETVHYTQKRTSLGGAVLAH